jgi:hypothetical protein
MTLHIDKEQFPATASVLLDLQSSLIRLGRLIDRELVYPPAAD